MAERFLLTVLTAGGLRCLLQQMHLHVKSVQISTCRALITALHAESKHHSTSGHWLSAMLVTSASFYNSFSVQNSTRPISLQCSTSLASVRRTALHNKHPPLAPPKSCVTKIHIYFLKCRSESTFSIHPMYLWSPGKVVTVYPVAHTQQLPWCLQCQHPMKIRIILTQYYMCILVILTHQSKRNGCDKTT